MNRTTPLLLAAGGAFAQGPFTAQIVTALQTIISRSVNITEAPAVVTVGRITGGNRANIIPDSVELEGTIRAFDENARKAIQARLKSLATSIAEGAGALPLAADGRFPEAARHFVDHLKAQGANFSSTALATAMAAGNREDSSGDGRG